MCRSHLTIPERVELYKLARNREYALEIGAYVGASACCFGAAFYKQRYGTLFSIDTWKNDAMSEGQCDTWEEFRANTCQYSSFIKPVRGYSTEVVDEIRESIKRLDLLFIDGDHSYAGVKADWEAYKEFLHPGSIVIFHDYDWADGVKRVVHEDVLPIVSRSDSLPNMWWGTIS